MPDLPYRIIVKDDGTATLERFKGNVNKTSASVKKAATRIRAGFVRIGGSINALPGKVLNLRNAFIGLAAGLAIRKFIQVFGDFESQMNRVQAITRANGDEFDSLKNLAKELGRTTVFTAGQAAEAMSLFAVSGFKTKEIMAALPDTLNLAAAGQLDLAQATDIVSGVLRGMGLPVSELSRANDVLVKTFTSSKVTIATLGESFKFIGPIARAAGLEFEEVSAAIGLLGDANIDASMAGTTLRGAISKLLNPSEEAASAMRDLGINVKDSRGQMLPLADIVEQFAPIANDAGATLKIFGQRAGPGLSALLNVGADRLRKFTAELKNSGGEADRVAKKQLEGMNGAIIRMKSAIDGLILSFDDFAPFINKIADFIGKLSANTTKAVEAISAVGDRMAIAGGSGFDTFLEDMLPTTETLIDAFFMLGKTILALKAAFQTVKLAGALVFKLILQGAAAANRAWFDIRIAINTGIDLIKRAAGEVVQFILDMAIKINSIMEKAIGDLPIESAQKFRKNLLLNNIALNQSAEAADKWGTNFAANDKLIKDQTVTQEKLNKVIFEADVTILEYGDNLRKTTNQFTALVNAEQRAIVIRKKNTAARQELAKALKAQVAASKVAAATAAANAIESRELKTPKSIELRIQIKPIDEAVARLTEIGHAMENISQTLNDASVEGLAGFATAMQQRLKMTEDALVKTQAQFEAGKATLEQLEEAQANKAIALNQAKWDTISSTTGAALKIITTLIGSEGEAAFRINQAVAIAQAVVNTAQGVTAALAMGPFGIGLAGVIAALGAVQIAAIASAKPGARASGGGGGGGGGGGRVPAAPGGGGVPAPIQQEMPEERPLSVSISVQGFLGSEAELASRIGEVMREAVNDGVDFGLATSR